MKKLFLLSLLFISHLCSASPDSIAVSRCYYHSDGVYLGYTYTVDRYDSARNFVLQNVVGEHYEPWVGYSYTNNRTTNTWNAANKILTSLSETWIDTGWVVASRNGYAYDASNNLLADTFFQFNPDTSTMTVLTWDANNDTTSMRRFFFTGGSYHILDSTHYIHNLSGQVIESLYYYGGAPLQAASRETFQYDASGRVIDHLQQHASGMSWVDVNQYYYQYDLSNRLTAYSYRQWDITYWNIIDTLHVVFSPTNKISNSIHARHDNFYNDSTIITNTYDANDSLSQVDTYFFRFAVPNNDSLRTIITRDANGHILDSLGQELVGGVYVNSWNFHHDLSAMPDTDHVYSLTCNGITCSDTLDFIFYTYDSLGRFQTYYIHHYVGGGQFYGSQGNGIFYDSQGRVSRIYVDDYDPGEHLHSNTLYGYNSNDVIIHYYNSVSGSLGIPYETECYYEFYLDTGDLQVSVLLDMDTACSGILLPAYLLITGGTHPYQISWNDTSGIINPNSVVPMFDPAAQMSYIVTVTDSSGDTDSANVNVGTSGTVLNLGTDTTICTGDTINVIAPPGFADYYWMTGPSSNSIAVSSAIPDTVLVSLTMSDTRGCSCSDTMFVFFDVCSGIEEPSSELIIRSMEDAYRITFPERESRGWFTLYNMEGKKMAEGRIHSTELLLPTSSYGRGIYILNVVGENWSENIRISIK